MSSDPAQIEHPSPHRHHVSVPWLLAGLVMPASAWALEMLIAYGIASNACTLTQGHHGQREMAGFSGEVTIMIVVQLVFLGIAIGSGVMSWRNWCSVRAEKTDSEHSHLTLGEGRTQFVALAGMLTAGIFGIAITFNLLEPLLIPLCWSFR